MNQEHYDYIWKNYRNLIEPTTGYSKIIRAALFPVNSKWPDAAEIEALKKERTKENLFEAVKEIEKNKNKYIDLVYEEIAKNIYFNYCPACNILAVSPKSERCINCRHEWYGTNVHRKNS